MINPYFSTGYQPYPQMPNAPQMPNVPQMPSNQAYPQERQNNSIIWVQGEAGAKSFLVGPKQTVQLWDSEAQTIYLKSADASGMPSMKVLDYTIREDGSKSAQNRSNFDSFVTKDELVQLEDRMSKKIERMIKERADE